MFNVREDINRLPSYATNAAPLKLILDANESPLNPPEVVLNELSETLKKYAFNRYPHITALPLREQLAAYYKLDVAQVQVGNGSSELIGAFCNLFAGRKILRPEPSFSMYSVYIRMAGAQETVYNLQKDFSVDMQGLVAQIKSEQPDLVIVCNPNNPTGNFTDIEQIKYLLENTSCPILLDEAYIEFAPDNALKLLGQYRQLIILRTFSKAFALANMRLGYVLAAPEVIELLSKMLVPYLVSGVSLAAGRAVLNNITAYEAQLAQLGRCREAVSGALLSAGFEVVPGSTNFVFFYHQDPQVMQTVAQCLKAASISVRDFTANDTLRNGIRLTLGVPEQNRMVMECIGKCMVNLRKNKK